MIYSILLSKLCHIKLEKDNEFMRRPFEKIVIDTKIKRMFRFFMFYERKFSCVMFKSHRFVGFLENQFK